MTPSMLCSRLSASCLLLASVIGAVPAWADTELRLKTQPITDPVQAFVTVTDEGGDPLAGLTAADFGVTLDGVPVVIQPSDLTLPPAQDPNQKIDRSPRGNRNDGPDRPRGLRPCGVTRDHDGKAHQGKSDRKVAKRPYRNSPCHASESPKMLSGSCPTRLTCSRVPNHTCSCLI